MALRNKTLFSAAAIASAIIATSPVSAATIINAFAGGPFSVSNPLGTVPATGLVNGNTYDFTFTLVGPLGSTASTQISAQLLANASSTPELIQYSLYAGDPGSGVFQSQSSMDYSPTVAFTPALGDYYVEVNYIARNNEIVGGTLTTAVPEPAAWAMMLVGFGALGVVLRGRSAKTAPVAV